MLSVEYKTSETFERTTVLITYEKHEALHGWDWVETEPNILTKIHELILEIINERKRNATITTTS